MYIGCRGLLSMNSCSDIAIVIESPVQSHVVTLVWHDLGERAIHVVTLVWYDLGERAIHVVTLV